MSEQTIGRPSKGSPPPVGEPVEEVAVTGRPADKPGPNSTFGSRSGSSKKKAVKSDGAEDKSVQSARKK